MLPDSLPMKASRLSGIAEENVLENCHQKPLNVLEFEVLPLIWTLAVMNMAYRITDDFGVRHVTVPSNALTSDDLDTQRARVQILLFVAVLFIYRRTFYTCSWSYTNFHYDIFARFFYFFYWKLSEVARVYS